MSSDLVYLTIRWFSRIVPDPRQNGHVITPAYTRRLRSCCATHDPVSSYTPEGNGENVPSADNPESLRLHHHGAPTFLFQDHDRALVTNHWRLREKIDKSPEPPWDVDFISAGAAICSHLIGMCRRGVTIPALHANTTKSKVITLIAKN